jgi:hypothetical protein
MADTLGISWLNSNSLRNYPLSQTATGKSKDQSFQIPDSMLLDMKLAIPFLADSSTNVAAINPAKFYISSIKVYPQGFVFFIGCELNSEIAVSEPIGFSTFSEFSTIAIRGISKPVTNNGQAFDFAQVYGFAVLGKIDFLTTLVGTFEFDLDGTRLESAVISYGPRRISGFKVYSDSSTSSLLSGQITLASGNNHRMTLTGTAESGYRVAMNAVRSDDFQDICECNDVELGPCVRKINNVTPDSSGNITIVGSDCIAVSPESDSSSIQIDDTCAKPCCGCGELEVLVSDVNSLTAQLALLQAQIGILSGNVDSLNNTCISSRVNATICAAEDSTPT